MDKLIKMLEEFQDAAAGDTNGDEHATEIAMRALNYAVNRVREGHAKTETEAKLAYASFADGFCTGFHRGSGTECTRK